MSKWISVKDRLPGLDIDWCIVLTVNTYDADFAFMATHKKNNEWEYFDSERGYEKSMTVTHWMPMPETPLI